MELNSTEIIRVIYQLLPGFIVAWIIYGLTAHLKPSYFERIIQALIFTVFVRAILVVIHFFSILIGENVYSFGIWGDKTEFVWSITIAISIGLFFTWCINNDFPLFLFRNDGDEICSRNFKWLNKLLSKIKLTNKTLHPTEWYSAFKSEPGFIVLHLTGERRLYGWPKQYPDDPQHGHFLIEEAEWLLDDGSSAPLYSVKQLLISSSDVEQIEFLKKPAEIEASTEDLDKAKKLLTDLYKKENPNDDQRPETVSKADTIE
ncbi:MAG: hypothetical protein JW786_04130 [Desulfobacterales bacterium]|nr:hypothetical protein [Desulfobacterales bacterium]